MGTEGWLHSGTRQLGRPRGRILSGVANKAERRKPLKKHIIRFRTKTVPNKCVHKAQHLVEWKISASLHHVGMMSPLRLHRDAASELQMVAIPAP